MSCQNEIITNAETNKYKFENNRDNNYISESTFYCLSTLFVTLHQIYGESCLGIVLQLNCNLSDYVCGGGP